MSMWGDIGRIDNPICERCDQPMIFRNGQWIHTDPADAVICLLTKTEG